MKQLTSAARKSHERYRALVQQGRHVLMLMDRKESGWSKLKDDSDAKELNVQMDALSNQVMNHGVLSVCVGVDFAKIKQAVGSENYTNALKAMAEMQTAIDKISQLLKLLHGIYELKVKKSA